MGDPNVLVDIVVDGEKRQVPLSEILDAGKRTLQKTAAADKRLEEATKLLREAKELKTVPVKPDPKTDVPSEDELKSLRAAYVRATQYGTEEEAVAAMEKWEEAVRKSAAPPQATASVTTDDVRKTIVAVQLEAQINASPEEGGFSDLMSRPILKAQTAAVVDSLVEQGKGSYGSFETYKQAAEAVRLMGSVLDPEYEAPVIEKSEETDPFKKKREKKKQIVSIKPATKKAVTTKKKSDDDDANKTTSDIIQEIAAARGQ
jgi:hypothetical protein